jgi:hypothetical protein
MSGMLASYNEFADKFIKVRLDSLWGFLDSLVLPVPGERCLGTCALRTGTALDGAAEDIEASSTR